MAPDAVSVAAPEVYKLPARFESGETRLFDASPPLARKRYAAMHHYAFFKLASAPCGCVTWPGHIASDPGWLDQDSVPVSSRHTKKTELSSPVFFL